MEGILLPLIIGLIGTSIGAAVSIITMIVQGYYENKRELSRLSAQMAVEEYRSHCEALKIRGGPIAPLGAYIHFYSNLMKLVKKDKLTPNNLVQLMETNKKVMNAIEEYQESVSKVK